VRHLQGESERGVSDDVWDDIESESIEDKIPRDRWKRPLIMPVKGDKPVAYTRVTTFAGSVEDTFKLGQWQQRMVAIGLSMRKDLLLSVAAHSDDKEELNKLTEAAKEAAAASAAATTGTALHKLVERFDRGQMTLAEMPESNRADVEAYARVMSPLKIHGIEQFVVLDDIRIAGTFDRIVEYDGQHYVADVKTGSIDYPGKMAVQLALYSRGRLYDPKTFDRTDTGVSQTAGLIIHLPAGQGQCDLYWIDLRAGWGAVDLCSMVRDWRKQKGLLAAASFGAAVIEPPVSEIDQAVATVTDAFPETKPLPLVEQIQAGQSRAEIEALWAEHVDEWTAEHTAAASRRINQLHHKVLKDAVRA
jgi:hypothetical protein